MKKEEPSVIKNFSILTFGGIFSELAQMVVNVLLARYLAPKAFGEYTLLLTYITIFYTIASWGLRQVVIRTIARNQHISKKILKYSVYLRIAGYIFSLICLLIYIKASCVGLTRFFLLWLLLGIWGNSLWEAFQNVAFGMQKVMSNTIVNVMGNGSMLLIIIAIPSKYLNFETAAIIYVFTLYIKDIIYLICLNKASLLTENDSSQIQPNVKGLFIQSMPFYILALFSLISGQFPIVFLESRSGVEEVAYFNSANKLLLPITMLGSTLFNAVFPFLAKSYYSNFDKFVLQVRKVLIMIVVGGVTASFIVSLFRNELVLVLFGNKYINTGNVMATQCWFTVMSLVFSLIGNVYGAADKQKLLAWTSIAYAAVSFPILYVSAKYGASGLSYGYLIMSVVNMSYQYYFFLKVVQHRLSARFSIVLFASIALSFALSMLILNDVSFYIRIVIFIIICLVFFRFLKKIFKFAKL